MIINHNTDTRVFNQEIAFALGNLNAAILLEQLHYWADKDCGVVEDGYKWIYNSYQNWVEQFKFWSSWQIRKAFNLLRSLEIVIVKRLRKKQWNQTNYYRIDYDRLAEFLGNYSKPETIEKSELCDSTDQDRNYSHLDLINSHTSYTKNTSTENLQRSNTPTVVEKINQSGRGKNKVFLNREMSAELNDLPCYKETKIGLSSKSTESNKVSEDVVQSKTKELIFWRSPEEFQMFYNELVKALPAIANSHSPEGLAKKIIKDLKDGIPCSYWEDFKNGDLIGTIGKPEWEIKPGVVYPMFVEYLVEKLREGNNSETVEQARLKALRLIVNRPKEATVFWGQFKRSVVNVSEQVERDRALGVSNPNTPVWTRERIEPSIEEAAAAGAKITAINDGTKALIEGIYPRMGTKHLSLNGDSAYATQNATPEKESLLRKMYNKRFCKPQPQSQLDNNSNCNKAKSSLDRKKPRSI